MPDASDQQELKWGDSFDLLSDKRKQELRERLNAWNPEQATEDHPGPFAGEHLNGLEVFWLAACALAGIDGDPMTAAGALTDFSQRWTLHGQSTILDLSAANMSAADLTEANLFNSNLSDANLSDVNLVATDLFGADLFGANLKRAILRQADLTETNLLYADLSEADLRHAKFLKAILSTATFYKADMRSVDLRWADLSGAHLSHVNLSSADLDQANLSDADLSEANLSWANLTGVRLVKTNLSRANLTACHIYGISVWNPVLDGAIQTNLRITPDGEAEITVDNLEMAQFLYLMLHNEKIREVIDTITSKVVLILGRFTKPRKRILDALRDELRRRNYLPVVFDFEKPANASTTETVTLLARMARFVIADLTDPRSVPYELARIVPDAHVPVQTLLVEGERTFPMAKDLWQLHPHLMLPLCRYATLDELLSTVPDRVIAPAEARAAELQRLRNLPVDGL